MAKDRVTPGDLAAPEALNPQAHPVDTFHDSLAAMPSSQNGGTQLAAALQGFQPGLAKYVEDAYAIDADKQRQKNTDQENQGAQAALENRQSFNDAIKNGVIRPAESPWFVKGFKTQQLRLNAMSYDEALRAAYQQSAVKNSNDPQAITGFIQDFTKNYTGNLELKDDPEFGRVFTPLANASAEQLVNLHAAYRSQQIEDQARNNTQQEAYKVMDNHFIYSGPEQIGKALDAVSKSAMAAGLSGTEANKAMVDAVTQAAKDNLDPSMLETLKHIPAGSGNIGGTSYAREQAQAAESHIYRLQWEQEAHFNATAERVKKEQSDKIIGDTLPGLYANPLMDISPQIAMLSKVNPEAATHLATTRDSWIKGNDGWAETGATVADAWSKVLSGQYGPNELAALSAQGKLSRITISKMSEEIPRVAKFSDKLNDPLVKQVGENLHATLKGNPADFTDAKSATADAAQVTLNRDMLDWVSKNPNATMVERYEYAAKSAKAIQSSYGIEPNAPQVIAPKQVLDAPNVSSINYRVTPLFNNVDEFKAAANEYNLTKGKAGTIVALSKKLGVPALDLYYGQNRLLGYPFNAPNPKTSAAPAGGAPTK